MKGLFRISISVLFVVLLLLALVGALEYLLTLLYLLLIAVGLVAAGFLVGIGLRLAGFGEKRR